MSHTCFQYMLKCSFQGSRKNTEKQHYLLVFTDRDPTCNDLCNGLTEYEVKLNFKLQMPRYSYDINLAKPSDPKSEE